MNGIDKKIGSREHARAQHRYPSGKQSSINIENPQTARGTHGSTTPLQSDHPRADVNKGNNGFGTRELVIYDSKDSLKKATLNPDGSLAITVFRKDENTGEIVAYRGGVMLTPGQFKRLAKFYVENK